MHVLGILLLVSGLAKVIIKYDEVIVLLHKVAKVMVLIEESFELDRWSIVCQLPRFHTLFGQHEFEEVGAVATSLN